MATKISETPRLPLRISSHSLMSLDIQSKTLIASPIENEKLMAATNAHARLRPIWNKVNVSSLLMLPPLFDANRVFDLSRPAGEAREADEAHRLADAAGDRCVLEVRFLGGDVLRLARRQPLEG